MPISGGAVFHEYLFASYCVRIWECRVEGEDGVQGVTGNGETAIHRERREDNKERLL